MGAGVSSRAPTIVNATTKRLGAAVQIWRPGLGLFTKGNTDAAIGNILGGLGKVGLTAALSGQYVPNPTINADGSIGGAIGPTSVGGNPLVGQIDGMPLSLAASANQIAPVPTFAPTPASANINKAFTVY